MVITAKSEDFSGRFVPNRAKMELVNQTEHANVRKAGAEGFATLGTSVEGILQNHRKDKGLYEVI